MTLWDAIKARLISWIFPKLDLTPGICECGHKRSSHKNGKWRCKGSFPPDKETPQWTGCSCQLFILDDDDDSDDEPETPTPSELEKIYNL